MPDTILPLLGGTNVVSTTAVLGPSMGIAHRRVFQSSSKGRGCQVTHDANANEHT